MSWRDREPRESDFDTMEEYYEALDCYYAALDDHAESYYESKREG